MTRSSAAPPTRPRRLGRALLGVGLVLTVCAITALRVSQQTRKHEASLVRRLDQVAALQRELRDRLTSLPTLLPACQEVLSRLRDLDGWQEEIFAPDMATCLDAMRAAPVADQRRSVQAFAQLRSALPAPSELVAMRRPVWEAARFGPILQPPTQQRLAEGLGGLPRPARCGTKRFDERPEEGSWAQSWDRWKERNYRTGPLCGVTLRLLWGSYEEHVDRAIAATDLSKSERDQVWDRSQEQLWRFRWLLRESLGEMEEIDDQYRNNRALIELYIAGLSVQLYRGQRGAWPPTLADALPPGAAMPKNPLTEVPVTLLPEGKQGEARALCWLTQALPRTLLLEEGPSLRSRRGLYIMVLRP